MLATLTGFLALLLGLSLLLLPLLVTELSRPRDSAWGAVVLLLGLVLVTSAERLTGAPMLAVLCGGLLVGRLGGEVAQGRWRALSDEERQDLRSSARWSRSLNQLAAAVASLVQSSLALTAVVSAWLAERRQGRSHGKRWVRAEATGEPSAPAAVPEGDEVSPPGVVQPGNPAVEAVAAAEPASAISPWPATQVPDPTAAGSAPDAETNPVPDPPVQTAAEVPGVMVVADFDGIDALLTAAQASGPDQGPGQSAGPSPEASIPASSTGPDA